MSEQIAGFYFSCNANKSANDYTIYVNGSPHFSGTATLGARYKNSEPNSLYEIEMDADDLEALGRLCIDFARQMQGGGA